MNTQQIIRIIDFWQKTIEEDKLKNRSLCLLGNGEMTLKVPCKLFQDQ